MSQWTHVNGAIRFDALRVAGMPFNTIESYKKLLGNTFSYEDDEEDWDKCNVPCGSEGSIQFNFWASSDLAQMAAFGVHVFGDLRDFGKEDVPKIEEWFNRVTTTEGVMVRSAILEIDIEGVEKPIILRHKEESDCEPELTS